jgi:hypothetical protein
LAPCEYKYKSAVPRIDFSCDEEARTDSKLCIFHDEKYVKDHYAEYEREATERFEKKVRDSSSENKWNA